MRLFFLRKCWEPVRRETTEVSFIEFIGYRMLQHEKNGRTLSFTRHQSKKVSDWLCRYLHLKLKKLIICESCCANGRHGTNISNIKISRHFVCHYSQDILAKGLVYLVMTLLISTVQQSDLFQNIALPSSITRFPLTSVRIQREYRKEFFP